MARIRSKVAEVLTLGAGQFVGDLMTRAWERRRSQHLDEKAELDDVDARTTAKSLGRAASRFPCEWVILSFDISPLRATLAKIVEDVLHGGPQAIRDDAEQLLGVLGTSTPGRDAAARTRLSTRVPEHTDRRAPFLANRLVDADLSKIFSDSLPGRTLRLAGDKLQVTLVGSDILSEYLRWSAERVLDYIARELSVEEISEEIQLVIDRHWSGIPRPAADKLAEVCRAAHLEKMRYEVRLEVEAFISQTEERLDEFFNGGERLMTVLTEGFYEYLTATEGTAS